MERLTYRHEGIGQVVPTDFDLDFILFLDNDTCGGLQGIFNKLAAYEDTSLSPERVAEMAKAERQRRKKYDCTARG